MLLDFIHYHNPYSDKVPTSRTINGYNLTANRSLTASDVGAAASSHSHSDYIKFIRDNDSAHTASGTNTISLTDFSTERPIFGYVAVPSQNIVFPIWFMKGWDSGTIVGNGYFYQSSYGTCATLVLTTNVKIGISQVFLNGENATAQAALKIWKNY